MDARHDASRFYDFSSEIGEDVFFYRSVLATLESRTLLELGCGTGRVLLALLSEVDAVTGVDISEGMLERLREKLDRDPANRELVDIVCQEICTLNLRRTYDLIIAPHRVFQNLETDEQVDGLLSGIRRHMAPKGTCVLNAFNPNRSRQAILDVWSTADPALETVSWERPFREGTLRHSYRQTRFTERPFVLYPELIYRYFEGGRQTDGSQFIAPMRVYFPDEFRQTILNHGFTIIDECGGYNGESYGDGPELIIRFCA